MMMTRSRHVARSHLPLLRRWSARSVEAREVLVRFQGVARLWVASITVMHWSLKPVIRVRFPGDPPDYQRDSVRRAPARVGGWPGRELVVFSRCSEVASHSVWARGIGGSNPLTSTSMHGRPRRPAGDCAIAVGTLRRELFPAPFETRLGTSFSRAKPLGAALFCQERPGWVRIPPSALLRHMGSILVH